MQVQAQQLIGRWNYETHNRIYHFYDNGIVLVRSEQLQSIFRFSIQYSNGHSWLWFDNARIRIVNISPNHIVFESKTRLITLWRFKA